MESHVGMTVLDDIVVGVFLFGMLAMGFRIGRKQQSTEDFFLGGRNLPAWAVGISIFASLLSTITYLGLPGEMFRTGVYYLTRDLPTLLVLFIVCVFLIPFFTKQRLTSAYEYLENRYDYSVRAIGAILCLLYILGWISVVVLTASRALVEIVNIDINWFFGWNTELHKDADIHLLIVAIGLFSIVYTTMGGIRAVVWTDVIQFLVLMAGAFFTMGFIAWTTDSGFPSWIETAGKRQYETVEWFSTDFRTRSTVFLISLNMFAWTVLTHGSNQVALQRYFSVRDTREARKSFLVNAAAGVLITFTLAGVGISLMHFLESHDLPAKANLESKDDGLRKKAQDDVFPQFIGRYLPTGLRGLVVAALFAAAMSTIDSGANSVSTIMTVDFLRKWKRGNITNDSELKVARILTASMGMIVVASTILLYHLSKGTDIITLCQKGFNCFLGPLGAIFFLGMFSRLSTAKTLIPAVVIGQGVGTGTGYCEELFSVRFSTHLVISSAFLATVVVDSFLALVTSSRASQADRQWMWKSIVRKNATDSPQN